MIARALLFASLVTASAAAQTSQIGDTLFMNDAAGTRRVGHLVGIDENSFKLEVSLGGGMAKATVGIPRSRVAQVEFAPSDARDRLVASPNAANAAALGAEWRRWKPFLRVSKSPAGAVGNAYALALLDSNDPAKALEIFKLVEAGAWSKGDESAAKQGRLRALVATGHASDAVAEAVELARDSDDPAVLVEAKFILAEAAQARLRKLVEDNPRWDEDPLVRPEYERLYNEALDLYLHPYLFLGSDTDAASRGLWGAVQVYRFGGDDRNAMESARDLTAFYAGSRYAKLAKDYLDSLPDALKKQDVEKDANGAD